MGKGKAYTAEEMPDKHDENSPGRIRPAVQALKGMRLSIAIKHHVVVYLAQQLGRRELSRGGHLAIEVLGFGRVDVYRFRWRLGMATTTRRSTIGGLFLALDCCGRSFICRSVGLGVGVCHAACDDPFFPVKIVRACFVTNA
jgi:hypothetical protein